MIGHLFSFGEADDVSRFSASLIVFIGAAGYGVLATFTKIGYALGFHVGEITGSQMLIGALVLWLLAFLKKENWSQLGLKEIISLLGVGSFTGLTGVFYYSSLKVLPASISIILLFQFTWIGVLLEWLIDKKRPTKTTLISLAMVMIGTVLAANLVKGSLSDLNLFGVIMGLCSALTYAFFILASGKVHTQVSPWLRSPLMITGSCLTIFILFPPTFFVSGSIGEGLWWLAPVMAFFGAILPTVCFNTGVPHIGSGMATILGSVELPVAVLMAWGILKESVTLLQWLGVLLILLAIVAGERETLRRELSKKSLSNV